MLAVIALAAALNGTAPVQEAPQDPAPAAPQAREQAPAPQSGTIRLEDVVVERRRLEEAVEAFVDEVAAPVRRRGLARWHDGVCVGVANLQPEVATYIVDRVSDVARDLGLRAGGPGCHPSIIIVATTDASAFTERFIAQRPRLFRTGAAGTDRGGDALEAFKNTDRPVRWWNVSLPVDGETGAAAVRMPGFVRDAAAGDGSAMSYAPHTMVDRASRMSSQYRQDLKRTFVIIDVDRLQGVSLAQLSDYIAMVTMAQIDPDADTSRYETILNLFGPAPQTEGLTGWDRAYLDGLYENEWYRINARSQVRAVSDTISREYRDGQADSDD